ncbi:arsenate reductase [Apiospora hydei]|uniref:Arsenate reductase n=1 Tax=Apiospora hydei TaxID=1337664 RepID=A0ABR1V1X5_9PEZI
MKFTSFLAPAFAGLAVAETAASQPSTEAYILRESRPASSSKDASSSPSISANAAQAILSDRLSANDKLAQDISEADYDVMNRFGKPAAKLFGDDDASASHQLVILYKGVDAENTQALKKALNGASPSFTSASALNYFPSAKSYNTKKCKFEDAIDPAKDACWSGVSRTAQYLEIDLSKDSKSTSALSKNMKKLQSLAQSGKMETLILIHPSAQAASANPQELRRRDHKSEVVLTDKETAKPTKPADANKAKASTSPATSHPFNDKDKDGNKKKKHNGLYPSCFASQDACNTATGNCTGHGVCENKWSEGSEKKCFSCRCLATTEKQADGRPSLYHWGGGACQKRDVSTPFWLLAGFTIIMISIVGFCINLLFQVGEEPLPGVIGAGVSRGGSK